MLQRHIFLSCVRYTNYFCTQYSLVLETKCVNWGKVMQAETLADCLNSICTLLE